ncbi:MAG: hypothetical protein ACHQ52_00645 [Candidatus Eisenbacteria bacterium]
MGRTRGMLSMALVLAMASWSAAARASETQMWIADQPADHARAESRGVVVRPDGSLRLGPRAESSAAESLAVIWAIAPLPDGSVAIAGDRGRVDRWTESGGVRPWVRLPVGQVLCLAVDGDQLVAGTGPPGLVYRIGSHGDTTLVARTGERYVWGLAPAGRGAWYAATGTRGRLMRVTNGKATIVLDTDESNLVSVVADGHGGAFAGGDSKGRVLRVSADGRVGTVFDASEEEIRALALAADGTLYAAGLGSPAITLDGAGPSPAGGDDDDNSPHPEARPAAPPSGGGGGGRATLYRIVPDSSAAAVWSSPQSLVFALATVTGSLAAQTPEGGPGIAIGTGNRAGVYVLGPPNSGALWLAMPQGQVTAMAMGRDGRLFAATSNPGSLWRLGPGRAERGELLSSVLDARRIARYGRVAWHGSAGGGRVTLATRTGNVDPPDTTWSAWAEARDEHAVSAPARYLQWRATLAGGDPRVESVEIGWREQNLPPRVDELTVAPQGIGFREGELTPRSEPVTQTLPSGTRVEYSYSATTAKTLRALPAVARGLRTLQWKGSDPNGDPLTYTVELRREGGEGWTEIGKDLDASSFTWDTNALPDGRYRVRVTASDAGGNGLGEGLSGVAVSEPFGIDNTPPTVSRFEARPEPGAVMVSGSAEDAQTLVTRLEVALDDGDWRLISPAGGLADQARLEFSARIPDVTAGPHSVAVRAVDMAGNTAVRSVAVTVAKR